MTKTAANSQEKKVVGASLAYAGNGIFSLRLKFSDDSNCVVGIPAEDVEVLIAQIEIALADGQLFFTAPNERRFVCELYALREIKTLFTKIRGDSDAKALGSRVNAQSKGATRTVRDAKQISEASAPKASVSSARQFNTHPKSGRRANAGSKSPAAAAATERPLRLKGRCPLRQLACANESIPSSGVTEGSHRKSRAVSCPREASISRCGGVKACRPETEKSPKPSGVAALGNSLPKGWRKCNVENPPCVRVKTKYGRTSVVVATRKVS